ncbi:endo-beta-1,3-glucanase [Pestalotiopsis sp. NC0098]|nr:endo-beta-1,3-glucanase [Pestalotiopsis sp. NC0098]
MKLPVSSLLGLACLVPEIQAACTQATVDFLNWKTFKGNGVNLGGWLVQEPFIDTDFWATSCGADVLDEWTCCTNLGDQCGPVLEQRYATWITTADIDLLASSGEVKVLRIPTTYSAWIEVPGSQLYHGNQTAYLSDIATYAIEQYGMHVVIDIHGLPGGINNGTIGERVGGLDWFYNQTALDWSLKAVDAVIDFIRNSAHPESFTLELINEPMDAPDLVGQPASLSEEAASWLLKYFDAVIERVEAADGRIPVMLQGSFKTPDYWSANFTEGKNIVFDVHSYYFAGRPIGPNNVTDFILGDAEASQDTSGKFPSYTGEWSIQTLYNNSFAERQRVFDFGLSAFEKFTQGSSYWTAKCTGNDTVDGEGTRADYWSYETFIDLGFFGSDSDTALP